MSPLAEWWSLLVTWWSPDAAYVSALLLTAGAGPLFRRLSAESSRRWFGLLAGLLLLACTCGRDAGHPLTAAVGNVALLRLVPPRCVKWGREGTFNVVRPFILGYDG